MNSTFARFLSFGLACVCFGLVRAQTPAVSPDHVTFYTEPNFKGEALTVEAGAGVENLDGMLRANNQPWTFAISSIQVAGAAKATVFTGPNFTGDGLEVSRSIADLYAEPRAREAGATWDRAIASLRVTGTQSAIVAPPPVMTQPPVTMQPPVATQPPVIIQPPVATPPPTVVIRNEPPPTTVYVVPGQSRPPPPPPVIIREVRPRMDRRTADAIVTHAYREVLNRPPDPEGLRTYRERLMNEGWSERQIVEQLQRSGEARGVNADEAIIAAYREVLGRDPDANGLAHYRAKWRDGWTQGQIRDDLRRSGEGRDSNVRAVITRAYRELLNRDPDPGGYATYEKAMRERGWTERQVRAALMSGDEYRKLHPRGR